MIIVSAILFGSILLVGGLLYLYDQWYTSRRHKSNETVEDENDTSDTATEDENSCCGMHITCEKDSLVAGIDRELLYYDDEELDRYRGREATTYSASETEEFREIMMTLHPEEIAGWYRSITARGITLPDDVREELLMIVAEARDRNREEKTA